MSKKRKHLLFMTPGTTKLNEATAALRTNSPLPKWAQPFERQLSLRDERDDEKAEVAPEQGSGLLFEGLVMLTTEQKREKVKHEYFNPKGFSTILPITQKLQPDYANVSRTNVKNVLRSLETAPRRGPNRLKTGL